MQAGDPIHLLQSLTVFSDEMLVTPGWIHFEDCPAVRGFTCRCGTTTTTLSAPRAAVLLGWTDHAVQVKVDRLAPLWVERAGIALGPLPKPKQDRLRAEIQKAKKMPPDYQAILLRIGDAEVPPTRSNRPIRGGDLCWIRGQPRTMATLLRFLCRIPDTKGLPLLLVRPDLFVGQAMSPTWADLHKVPAATDEEPSRHLVSAFGTLSMPAIGWTDTP